MSDSPFLTVFDVAERWQLKDPQTVRDAIERKHLPATKPAGKWLVLLEDVKAYESSRRNVHDIKKRTTLPRKRSTMPKGRAS